MADPAALIQSLERAKIVYYMHVAATCVFIYDHLTTLEDELGVVWTAGKAFFLVSRYITWPEFVLTLYMELADLEAAACHRLFIYIAASIVVAILVTEMILVLRTWALWGARRSVLLALAVLLLGVGAAEAAIVVPYVQQTVFIRAAELVPSFNGCVIAQSTRRVAIAWTLLTLFELVIVILTVIKGVEQFRVGHASNLITSLYRDGIMYFIYLFVVSLGNVLCILTAPSEYVVLFGVVQRAFNAILSCRIIVHLQQAAQRRGVSTNGLLSTMPVFADSARKHAPRSTARV